MKDVIGDLEIWRFEVCRFRFAFSTLAVSLPTER